MRERLSRCAPWLAVMAFAALLRLLDLDTNDVWVDEANSVLTAQQSGPVLLDLLSRDSSPPLYYFLLHAWMGWVGDGPVALRLPSVAFSLGIVAAVYAAGAREVSRRVGLWAAFLVALSPAQIFYSQQIRMYTLLPLLAFAAWWWLVRYLRDGRRRDYWLSLGATAAALYTHNFALYVPLVHVALVLGSGQLRPRFRMWALAAALLGLAYAPWFPTLWLQVGNADHYAWYAERAEREGAVGALIDSAKSLSPLGSVLMYARVRNPDWHGIPALVTTGFALFGGAVLVRRRRALPRLTPLWWIAACVVPVAAALASSAVFTPHYVPGRVDQMVLPCFALLTAAGLAEVRPRALQALLVLGFLIVAIFGRSALYSDYREVRLAGGMAELSEAVRRELRPGDVVLCTSLTRASLSYYLQRAGVSVPILSFPRSTARHLGSQNHRALLADERGLQREAEIVIEQARARAGPGGRLLLLRTNVAVNDPLRPGPLLGRFGIEQESQLGRFKLTGTKEIVWLTSNRLDRSARSTAEPSGSSAPQQ